MLWITVLSTLFYRIVAGVGWPLYIHHSCSNYGCNANQIKSLYFINSFFPSTYVKNMNYDNIYTQSFALQLEGSIPPFQCRCLLIPTATRACEISDFWIFANGAKMHKLNSLLNYRSNNLEQLNFSSDGVKCQMLSNQTFWSSINVFGHIIVTG